LPVKPIGVVEHAKTDLMELVDADEYFPRQLKSLPLIVYNSCPVS
jgi:hypothetical protein